LKGRQVVSVESIVAHWIAVINHNFQRSTVL